jgi:hypothetical protein
MQLRAYLCRVCCQSAERCEVSSYLEHSVLDVQNILAVDAGISRQIEGHSFGDHLISGSVSVTPSSVIETSIVLGSVYL